METKITTESKTDLHSIMVDVHKKNWDLVNVFSVQFLGKGITDAGINDNAFNDAIASSIISVDTPQFNSQNIESFMGGRWYINNGRDEVYRFSMTFRDFNDLSLYRSFTKMYLRQRHYFFNDVEFSVTISGGSAEIYKFEETIIDSLSQIQFNNNTESQITEFTVQFKTSAPFVSSDIKFSSLKI